MTFNTRLQERIKAAKLQYEHAVALTQKRLNAEAKEFEQKALVLFQKMLNTDFDPELLSLLKVESIAKRKNSPSGKPTLDFNTHAQFFLTDETEKEQTIAIYRSFDK